MLEEATMLTIRQPPFNALRHRVEDHPNPDLLAASTNQYNHGAHWNGGETYTVIGHIGRGAFASVFRLQNKRHGEVFACKELQKSRFLKDGNFNQKGYLEVDIMKGLTHVSQSVLTSKAFNNKLGSQTSSSTLNVTKQPCTSTSSWNTSSTAT